LRGRQIGAQKQGAQLCKEFTMRLPQLVGIFGRRTTFAALTAGTPLLLGALSPATASTSPQIIHQEVAGLTFLNPCTGEHMTITSGTLQLLVQVTDDASGGLHVVVHGNAQGVVATGEVTGDMYRLAGDFWTEENLNGDDGLPLVIQVVEVHDVDSQGSSDNFIVHVVSHLTLNADGAVTASVDSVSAECRG
jgi:hypothetical protein